MKKNNNKELELRKDNFISANFNGINSFIKINRRVFEACRDTVVNSTDKVSVPLWFIFY